MNHYQFTQCDVKIINVDTSQLHSDTTAAAASNTSHICSPQGNTPAPCTNDEARIEYDGKTANVIFKGKKALLACVFCLSILALIIATVVVITNVMTHYSPS